MAAAGQHHPRHLLAAGGLQHVVSAGDVVLDHLGERPLLGNPGEVDDHRAAGGVVVHRGGVTQVGLDKLGALGHLGNRVLVEQPQRCPASRQVGRHLTADGPGGSGDQPRHGRWWSIAATPSSPGA